MNNLCPNCRAEIPYGARFFCANCGTSAFGGQQAPTRGRPGRKRPSERWGSPEQANPAPQAPDKPLATTSPPGVGRPRRRGWVLGVGALLLAALLLLGAVLLFVLPLAPA